MIRRVKIFIISLLVVSGLAFAGAQIAPKQAAAAITVSPSVCSNCPAGSPLCVTVNFPKISTLAIKQAFQQVLQQFMDSFTSFFDNIFNNFLGNLLTGINDILEGGFIQWQDNFLAYDLIPAKQMQMNQINTAYVDSSRAMNSAMDGVNNARTIRTMQKLEIDAAAASTPHQQTCVAATLSGSNFARANSMIRAFRKASERMFTQRGSGQSEFKFADNQTETQSSGPKTVTAANLSNSRFSPGFIDDGQTAFTDSIQKVQLQGVPRSYGAGPNAHQKYQFERYCRFLVSSDDNGGKSGCGNITVQGDMRGMDVKPTEFLFNKFTIDVTQEPIEKALEAVKENLTGLRPPPLIPGTSLETASGRQRMIDQRSYLARQNAARSVVEYVSSMRLPTTEAGNMVRELREKAGIPLSNIDSDKASYKEIMNAMSTEKFMTGKYNLGMIDCTRGATQSDPSECIKRESLILSVFYLMQLRDYYELMERAVLTLAVQTSIELGGETGNSGTRGAR